MFAGSGPGLWNSCWATHGAQVETWREGLFKEWFSLPELASATKVFHHAVLTAPELQSPCGPVFLLQLLLPPQG